VHRVKAGAIAEQELPFRSGPYFRKTSGAILGSRLGFREQLSGLHDTAGWFNPYYHLFLKGTMRVIEITGTSRIVVFRIWLLLNDYYGWPQGL